MGRIKILNKNNKPKFMITTVIIFALITIIAPLLLMFSPIYTDQKLTQIQALAFEPIEEQAWVKYFFIFAKNPNWDYFIFLPTKFVIFWLPIFISSFVIVLMIYRYLTHKIGYKSVNKENIARIVRPIKSYQCTMIVSWLCLVALTIAMCCFYFGASAFLNGNMFQFSWTKAPTVISDEDQLKVKNIISQGNTTTYWFSFYWFKDGLMWTVKNDTLREVLCGLFPASLLLIAFVLAIIGVILGECSWWAINLAVLRSLDQTLGTTMAKEIHHVNKPKVKVKSDKKVNIKDLTLDQLQEKCILYYKNLVKLLELSNNIDSHLYKEAQLKYENLVSIEKNKDTDWDAVGKEIEDKIAHITLNEQKFAKLIEELLLIEDIKIFGRYKEDLESLIEQFDKAIEDWDLLEAEVMLEQIFAIAFRNEELLAKVGYCIKDRLRTNFNNIEAKNELLNKLESAKLSQDYSKYRNLCYKAILEMSPIKDTISNYVEKIIYN